VGRGLLVAALVAAALAARPATAAEEPNAVSSSAGPVVVAGPPPAGAGQGFDPGDTVASADAPPPPPDQPGTEAVGAESVINVDDRTRVQNTDVYPNSAIGQLRLLDDEGQPLRCTGFLIDANTVLTAGHCVHQGGTGSDDHWFTNHVFTPGENEDVEPFPSCNGVELWTLPRWYDEQDEYHDIGIVQLDCTVGNQTGWLGYFALPGRRALLDMTTHVRGYKGLTEQMWTDKGRVWASQGQMTFYRNDTSGGQSGSPVFKWRNGCLEDGESGPCAMAVHAYGTGHGSPPHKGNNHGPRITEERLDLIATIAAENG
jgi:glutamyl endopeptidase